LCADNDEQRARLFEMGLAAIDHIEQLECYVLTLELLREQPSDAFGVAGLRTVQDRRRGLGGAPASFARVESTEPAR
jgi:hypothetical protein